MKQYTRLLMALLLAALMSLAALSALASAVDDDTIPQERVTAVLSRDEEDGSIAVNGEVLGADQVALVRADGQTVVRDMSEPERQAIAGARWELQGVAGARGDDWNETYADNGGTNPETTLSYILALVRAVGQAVAQDMMDAERSAIAVARVDERNEYNAYNGGNDSEAPMLPDILDSSDDAGTGVHNAGGDVFAILGSSGDLSLQGGVKLDGLEITNNASDSTVTLEGGSQATNVAVDGDNVTLNVQEGAKADNVLVGGVVGTILDVDGKVSNVYKTGDQPVAIEGEGDIGAFWDAEHDPYGPLPEGETYPDWNAEDEPLPDGSVGATADTAASDVSLASGATGLEAYGFRILVHPSGAGKVTYNDGEYIVTANPGYAFVGWSWRVDANVDEKDYSTLKNSAANDPNRSAKIWATTIETNAKALYQYKYLIALFERTGFDNPVETNEFRRPEPTTADHEWGRTTYKWKKDYSKCTAISKCSHCPKKDKVKSRRVEKKVTFATCTEGGSITYTAIFRNKKLNTSITVETPALDHTPAEAVRENEVAATCTAKGSYDRVVYCAVCKAELSRETVETEALSHTPAEAVRENEAPATCAAKGSYDRVVYCAVCKAELSRETVETEALSHTPAEAVRENEVAATCTAKGSYDRVVYCAVCKAELSRETVETEALGHTGGTATCLAKAVCKRCGEAYGEFGAHVYVSTNETWKGEETVDGKHYFTWGHYEACSVCKDVKKVEDGRQEIQEEMEPTG